MRTQTPRLPNGTEAIIKKHLDRIGPHISIGDIVIYKFLTVKNAGVYESNRGIWYLKKVGFKPRSGNWWSDSVSFRLNFLENICIMYSNPIITFCKQHVSD